MKKLFLLYLAITSFLSFGVSQDLSNLYEESIKSVVTIFTTEFKFSNNSVEQEQALGSGVIIGNDGLIITAAHVIESANLIKVKLHDDNIYNAEVIRSIPSADVGLIKIIDEVSNLVPAKINEASNEVKTGQRLYIIGAPLGIEHSLSSGYISGFMQKNFVADGQMAKFIQTDAAINNGNSGGLMFNMNGQLIGIVSFILSQSGGFDGIGYGVDIRTAKELLLDDKSHFWSGFDGYFLDESLSAVLNVPQKAGLLIQRVSKNSFAAEMGLEEGFFQAQIFDQKLWLGGDIILEILGSSCESPHSLNTIKERIKKIAPGDSIYLKVLRRGKIIELTKRIN